MAPKLLGHSAIYMAARIVPGAISLLTISVYTYLLAPVEYGFYALVIAGMDFGQRMLFIWLPMGLLRFLPAYPERRASFLSTAVAGFLMSVAVTVLAGAILLLIQPHNIPLGLILAGILLLWTNSWFELNLELVRADLRPIHYGVLEAIRAALALALGGFLAWRGLGALGVLMGMIFGRLVPMVWLVLTFWRDVSPRLVDWGILKRLLSYGLPLLGSYLAAWLVDFSDRFFLSKFIGAGASGLYAASYDLPRYSILYLAAIIHLAAFPLNVHALEKGGVRSGVRSMRQNMLALLMIALPATVGLIMLAPNIAASILGPDFQDAATSLIPLLAIGMFFFVMRSYYVNYTFQLTGRTLFQMWISIGTAVLSVTLNIILIPRFGLKGAAYAALCSYIFAFFVSLFFARRIFPLPFKTADLLQSGAIAAAMALALWPLAGLSGRLALCLQIATGLTVVAALAVGFNILGLRTIAREKLAGLRDRRRPSAP